MGSLRLRTKRESSESANCSDVDDRRVEERVCLAIRNLRVSSSSAISVRLATSADVRIEPTDGDVRRRWKCFALDKRPVAIVERNREYFGRCATMPLPSVLDRVIVMEVSM